MEDIHFLANEGADALVIPKVEDIDNINVVEDILKNLRTVEMIVLILAIAFVISKIFDMFRVKVEV